MKGTIDADKARRTATPPPAKRWGVAKSRPVRIQVLRQPSTANKVLRPSKTAPRVL